MGYFFSHSFKVGDKVPIFETYYTTFSLRSEAKRVSKTLLKEKLIVCANILGECLSLYHFEGKDCEDKEWATIFKINGKKAKAFEKRFFELHSYSVPSLVKMSSQQMSREYLRWVKSLG